MIKWIQKQFTKQTYHLKYNYKRCYFILFLGNEKEGQSPAKAGRDNESQAEEKIPYPKSVFLIIATEFCERFSYYGMRSETFYSFISPISYVHTKLGRLGNQNRFCSPIRYQESELVIQIWSDLNWMMIKGAGQLSGRTLAS